MENSNQSLNRKSANFKKLKILCKEYLREGKENSPDYGLISLDIADACTNWLMEIGEIK